MQKCLGCNRRIWFWQKTKFTKLWHEICINLWERGYHRAMIHMRGEENKQISTAQVESVITENKIFKTQIVQFRLNDIDVDIVLDISKAQQEIPVNITVDSKELFKIQTIK
ncbi:hypothetical protein A3K80_07435 [Candidatus Bathyarchaeota archaeon RBG_13_38_9]|nr:MAG: hypothetical protein A3K80_07435 [Candidatus Bathyarchaeota archaeon RBG_13_38_9]